MATRIYLTSAEGRTGKSTVAVGLLETLTASVTRVGVFRFFQTPHDRWLAPGNAKASLEAKRALKRAGNDRWLALADLVERYPHGVM